MKAHFLKRILNMQFPERLALLRKNKKLTQQSLADAIKVNVSQLKRYEAGTSQPTLDVLRKMAIVLSVSADMLLFDKDERGPNDELKLQFEAVSQMSPEDKLAIKTLLDGMIVKHQTKQIVGNLNS